MEFLKVVIDSNILLRTLISRGDILRLIFNRKLKLFAPEKLKEEFENHKKEVLLKSKLSEDRFNLLLSLILKRIIFVSLDKYNSFILKALKLLKEHKKDKDFLALCLFMNVKFWTYEKRFFDLGLAISTKQISEQLKKES